MILDDSWDMPPVKRGRRGVSDADDEDDDYRRRRDRNNEASTSITSSSNSIYSLIAKCITRTNSLFQF